MVDPAPFAPSLPSAPANSGEGAASEVYGLEELLAVAGERLGEEISPRTVRLYATQGLIDRPGREGRHAVYGRRHLHQLLLIRSLARRGLSLAAIAPLLGLDDQAMEGQLSQLEGDSPQAAASWSAVASTAATVAGGALSTPEPGLAERGVEAGGSPQAASPQATSSERDQALDYLRRLQPPTAGDSHSPSGLPFSSSDLSSEADSAERSASLLPLLGSPLSSRSPSRLSSSRSAVRSPSRSGGSREAASRWHRFSLAPGVELQISESVSIPPPGSRRLAWLQRLTARLLQQLEDSPP
jgi:DNA-binding transcriptional MerR regulator